MTKKERFPLKMANDVEVRNIDDFKTHFDIDLVAEYFFDGRLLTWLEERYYDEEATEIKKLSPDDERLEQKLCKIFDKETPEEIARRERLNRLKKYTKDETILANVDKVAFDQEELADLLDEDAKEIFLCANRFVIPLRMTDKNYIGVGNAVAVIRRSEPVNFEELNITFKNVAFDDDYQKILPPTTVAPPTEESNKDEIETSEAEEEIQTTIKNFNSACAAAFVHTAKKFTSTIRLKVKNKTVDAKSVLRIMTISWGKSNKVTVTAKGSDAKEAVDALKNLIDSGFPGASLKNHEDYSEIIFALNNETQESQIAIFWQKANTFKSEVNLKGKDKFGNNIIIDAKDIYVLMAANFKSGEELTLAAEGDDARQTVSALKKLIDSDFPESSAKGGTCATSTITVGNLNRTSGDSAAILVQVARKFKSNILLRASGKFVDAKKLLDVVDLGLVKGSEIILAAKGEDARQSVNALKKLIDSNFPESSAKGGNCAATTITIGRLNHTSDDSAIALVQTAKKFKAKNACSQTLKQSVNMRNFNKGLSGSNC